ncbi:hypothetical protein [Haliangium ochraceum]|uniref:Uncharacterized protein n=1 Tax=Haliangium ochraceum (strain DSM 14365 / JCM 11303 / SMP-2) TaxID=502025 RepID=D0LI46_HALO1|nr:hypothetical protein [Haliangium ochraceum]ACY16425.1 hypothetical protein Hoch_3926 [Haliangium ochraceum DSM 14365]
MGEESWLRGEHEGRERPFDWRALADEFGIPLAQAQLLYGEAVRRSELLGPRGQSAEDAYRESLEQVQSAERSSAPGRLTLTMREQELARGGGGRQRPGAPGKRTRTGRMRGAAGPGGGHATRPVPSPSPSTRAGTLIANADTDLASQQQRQYRFLRARALGIFWGEGAQSEAVEAIDAPASEAAAPAPAVEEQPAAATPSPRSPAEARVEAESQALAAGSGAAIALPDDLRGRLALAFGAGTDAPAPAPRRAPGRSSRAGGDAGGGAGSGELLMAEPAPALAPGFESRLASAAGEMRDAALGDLPAPAQTADDARAAAVIPADESDARAQAGLLAALDERPPPSPEIEAACEHIHAIIRAKRPPDDDSLVQAKPREMAAEAGGALNQEVEARAGAVREGFADLQQQPAGEPGRPPTPLTLPPEELSAQPPALSEGALAPVEDAEVSLDADLAAQRRRVEDAGMSGELADLVQDGPIAEARAGLGEMGALAEAGPAQTMAEQAAAIAQASGDMQALQAAASEALARSRSSAVGSVAGVGGDIQGSEEEQRAQAGAAMQARFASAQQEVDALMAPLGPNALARWEAGVDQLAGEFEASLGLVQARIDERYRTEDNGSIGDEARAGVLSLWDWAFGMPDWVTEEYDRAETLFADGCTALLRDISSDVNAVIESCQGIIGNARADIERIADSLPEELRAWAQGEAARLGTELDALAAQVDASQSQVSADLIGRANQAVHEVREQVHALRQEALGAVGRIGAAVSAFLADPGRMLVNGLLRVVGIPPEQFWSFVDKLGAVVDRLAEDPVGFGATLLGGIGQGFDQFFANFPAHLQAGLMQWLSSALSQAGVPRPMDFSAPGIFSMVLDVLGITWDRIRVILAKHIGEDNVEHFDRAYDIIKTFIAHGPLGLVDLLRQELSPETIFHMVRETAVRFLVETLVEKAAARIATLFVPGGAVYQALRGIYQALEWVYYNAARLFRLFDAVVTGAAEIASGNTAGLALLVEGALSGMMGPVIDFVAEFIGLGNVPEMVGDALEDLRAFIAQGIDKVIGFIVAQARSLLDSLGLGNKDDEGEDDEEGDDESLEKPISFDAATGEGGAREGHEIYFRKTDSGAEVIIESTPMRTLDQLRQGAFAELFKTEAQKNTLAGIETKLENAVEAQKAAAAAAPKSAKRSKKKKEAREILSSITEDLKKADHDYVYPSPEWGTYQEMCEAAGKEAPLDGRTREAHHLPYKALAHGIKTQLEAARDTLPNAQTGRGQRFHDLYHALKQAATNAETQWDEKGNNLSAILIHAETHRGKNGAHSADVVKIVHNAMKNADEAQSLKQPLRADETPRAAPGKKHWKDYVGGLMPAAGNTAAHESISTEAILQKVSDKLRECFEEARAWHLAVLRKSLTDSKLDGENPVSALDEAADHSHETWRPFHDPQWN